MRALRFVALLVLLTGCAEEVVFGVPPGFGDDPGFDPGFIPDSGVPATRARVLEALGEALFFDPALSGNGNVACATCHVTFLATAEGLALSLGEGAEGIGPFRRRAEGAILPRHTQDLFQRGPPENRRFFWDGRVEGLPDGTLRAPTPVPEGLSDPLALASILPLLDRAEMRGQPGQVGALGPNELGELADDDPLAIWAAVVRRLERFPEYPAQADEIGRPFDAALIGEALAVFITSRWGRPTTRRDAGDVNEVERRGERLFFGRAGCARCHGGPLLSDDGFHNIGVPPLGPGMEDGTVDGGRFRVTGDPADRFAFKTPPLRNVRLTPPYMHDGAYATLEAAVRHHLDPAAALAAYDGSELPPTLAATVRFDLFEEVLETLAAVAPEAPLTDVEVAELVAFLGTLDTLIELQKFANSDVPDRVPSGLPVPRWPEGRGHPFR